MRQVIIVLIALLALSIFTPTIWAKSTGSLLVNSSAPLTAPADTPLTTTPTMADFLNDSWMPPSYVAPTYSAVSRNKQGYVANATENIANFLNNSYQPPGATKPNYQLVETNNQRVGTGGENIYQFLDPDWTPTAPVEVVPTAPFKLHQIN